MKFPSRSLICSVAGFGLMGISTALAQGPGPVGPPPPSPTNAGPLTTVSGSISHLNYDREAEVEGFVLSNKTVVHLPPGAHCSGFSAQKGDTVEVSGYSQTSPQGVATLEAQSVEDRTSNRRFAVTQPGSAAPFTGSGKIQELNYGADGAINGFILDNGSLALVPPFGAGNPSSVRIGGAVSYAGYARKTMSGRTVVDVRSLTVNGQALQLDMGPDLAGPPSGPGRRARAIPPPPPGPPAADAPAGPGEGPGAAVRPDAPPPTPQPPKR